MKRSILLLLAVTMLWSARAQDTTRVVVEEKEVVTVTQDTLQTKVRVGDKDVVTVTEDSIQTKVRVGDKNVVTVVEDSVGTVVKVGDDGIIEVDANHAGDTVKIRIGNRTIKVVDSEEGTSVKTSREPVEKRRGYGKFNGHWGGFEMGINTFHTTDYSLYEGTPLQGYEFFDLNHGKSITVNFNIAEWAFTNPRNTVGLVTGLGFSLMDFRFDDADHTIAKGGNAPYILEPVMLEEAAKKSKLNVAYLTAPLILEVATPLRLNAHRLTLAAGVIGGLNIGSHTKVKFSDSKEKERGNFHLNSLKYELTGRLGLGELCLFANYGMSPLFREGRGPALKPLTIGISFPNVSF